MQWYYFLLSKAKILIMLLVLLGTSFKYILLEWIKLSINLVYTMTGTIYSSISVSTWKKDVWKKLESRSYRNTL